MSAEPEARGRRRLAWPLILIGLIAAAVITYVAVAPARDTHGRAAAGAVRGGTPDVQLRVSQAQPLAGTNFVEIDIGTGSYDGGSFSSSGPVEQRNILLLDRTTGSVRRLLPDNGRNIQQAWFLPAEANFVAPSSSDGSTHPAEGSTPAYFVLLVAQTENVERRDLLVGSLAGPGQRVVMQGIDGVDSIWMQSATQIGVLARERMNLSYRIIDIPTLRVVQQHPVAIR